MIDRAELTSDSRRIPLSRGSRLTLAVALLAATASGSDAPTGIEVQPFAPRSRASGSTMFTEMPPGQTGIVTENRYDDPMMWAERYAEFTTGPIGTGVAVADYDNDGRPDIFVVSKTESCRLFRNLGDWKFADVTESAGVADAGLAARVWKQGASFADVNNDGWLDLYVCRFDAPNLLYMNQRDGTFRDEARLRGLAVDDASVMGAFCDYDRDGWLDVFVQTNRPEAVGTRREQKNHLFRNRGDGTFEDVTASAGIGGRAQGHSAIWWDFDEDGWPDLYVANDFTPPDQLYRNRGDGTLAETIESVVPHSPFSAMGADLGDVNNDGHIDLLVADMAATTHEKDQRTMANARALIPEPVGGSRAAPFFMRNALYLNTGTGRMLEAACLAGIAATDWTWSVRLADLDNDGWLDLHVTNGMHREPHNVDLMARIAAAQTIPEKIRLGRASPVLAEANLAFRNRGDLAFEDVSAAWGLNEKGVSFGAASGDFDHDGDLDLVYTNYRKGATVLRNDAPHGHRLIVALRGRESNRFGVGATVRLETERGAQTRSLVLARGVLSSSEPVLHFGLGEESRARRLTIAWPSGRTQRLESVAANQRIVVVEPVADTPPETLREPPTPQFSEVSAELGLAGTVREIASDELGQQPLLPLRQGRRGPAVAVADIDGDARDEVWIGGGPGGSSRLHVRDRAGGFSLATANLAPDEKLGDGPLLLFDANGDGFNDMLATKGGVGRPAGAAEYQPRLWFNDRRGGFQPAPAESLPAFTSTAGVAIAADFDRAEGLDLFVGGRGVPGRYPATPRSALFANRGGKFDDVTAAVAPALAEIGMVTAALWTDVDADGWIDLLIAVEWGGVKFFRNRDGKQFEDRSEAAGFAAAGTGWWSSLAAADFNGDRRIDYAVGNVGLNTPYRADARHPVVLFAGDFGGAGAGQLIEGYYEGDRLLPRRSRRELAASIPTILKRYPRNDGFARATLVEIVGEDRLTAARRLVATELRSGVFLSQKDGGYRFEPLPRLAQIAPIKGMAVGDFDGDGDADIYALQNSHAPVAAIGRFDGGLSQLLRGDGHGRFEAVPAAASGLVVSGDGEGLAVWDLDENGWPDLVATRHDDSALVFRNRGVAGRRSTRVLLRGSGNNRSAIGARVTAHASDGASQTVEVHAGSGYYGQSTAGAFFGWSETNPLRQIEVRWPSGSISEHGVADGAATVTISMGTD